MWPGPVWEGGRKPGRVSQEGCGLGLSEEEGGRKPGRVSQEGCGLGLSGEEGGSQGG